MSKRPFYLFFCAMIVLHQSFAQIAIPFESPQWQYNGTHKLEIYKGKNSLSLTNASAYIKDLKLKNGIIEYDVAFGRERGFAGVQFRIKDSNDYEEYYMRPHQSGNPDAMQYTPVFNGLGGWQLYYGDGYGTPYTYNFENWMHVKLVVKDSQMEVYIDDMTDPVLYAFELKRPIDSGFLGLYSNLAEIHFANFQFQPLPQPVLASTPKKLPPIPSGTILSWQVSEAFSHTNLENKIHLDSDQIANRKWSDLKSESSGTANLARINERTKELNTVFSKFTVESDQDQIKALDFGYSDEVKIYVNNNLIYSGQRNYRSRDYRYLGTIGYFDTVYLPLKSGKNEIHFAVSENFGGWGVRAKFQDLEGIVVE